MRPIYVALAVVISCARVGSPIGQAIIHVDTDMPVPSLVAHLRVDFYTTDGRWYATRDVAAFKPTDWPLSFGTNLPDNASSRLVIIRLRAYAEGKTRDYHGERFVDRNTLDPNGLDAVPVAGYDLPLAGNDGEPTPRVEPEPTLAIDRLLLVRLEPGFVRETAVVLRGACAGTMADLAGKRTCIDAEKQLVPLIETPLQDTVVDEPRRVGAYAAPYDGKKCTVTPRTPTPNLFDDEVCVPGGVFIFGSRSIVNGRDDDARPERVAIVPPFLMDKFEVSVGRFRAAVAAGFAPPDAPFANNGPMASDPQTPLDSGSLCTFTAAPSSREGYPLNCVSRRTARAFCEWAGGALPREVEWEMAAVVAGRTTKALVPWGGDPSIACDQAVFDRSISRRCPGFGPAPLAVRGDVSAAGIVDMGGSLDEMTFDSFASFESGCWMSTGAYLPSCAAPMPQRWTARGASWVGEIREGAVRRAKVVDDFPATLDGFRCVRKGVP